VLLEQSSIGKFDVLAGRHSAKPNLIDPVAVELVLKPIFSNTKDLICTNATVECAKVRFQV
jgi:hypothetical protein